MNRVICVNGHFYDGDKYGACPHCAEGTAPIEPEHFSVARGAEKEEKEVKKEKKSFFKKKEVKEEIAPTPVQEDKTAMYSDVLTASQPSIQREMEQKINSDSMQYGASMSIEQPIFSQPVVSQQMVSQSHTSVQNPFSVQESRQTSSSLSDAFMKVSEPPKDNLDEGKTVGFFSTGKSTEPPVGYLICVAGEDFGIGFPLKSGNNAIGRSQSMDVVLMDAKVSREKQAFVMYEPYKREFYIKPGEGNGLCYFNDDVVLAPAKIGAYDTIMLGDTKLMLVPVCCDRFSWDV